MSIELQNLDSNCNSCKHMIRDFERYQQSLKLHEKWQRDYYEIIKKKMPPNEAAKYRFQFDRNEASIQYGTCSKLLKNVSFIPNICMPENQECFKNRKE